MYNWDVICTYHNKLIHLKHLEKSNPKANILLADISKYNANFDTKYCWRNSDIFIRRWIRDNRKNIQSDNIAIIEWDVLMSSPLPDIKINGLMAKDVQHPNSDREWFWFKEIYRLKSIKKYAIGISPLAVIFMDQLSIDTWINKEFDDLCNSDIFSELRLPSLLNSKNIPISIYKMDSVEWNKIDYSDKPDIYHPIKKEIYTTPI